MTCAADDISHAALRRLELAVAKAGGRRAGSGHYSATGLMTNELLFPYLVVVGATWDHIIAMFHGREETT